MEASGCLDKNRLIVFFWFDLGGFNLILIRFSLKHNSKRIKTTLVSTSRVSKQQ